MISIHPIQTGRVHVRPGYLRGDWSFVAQLVEALLTRRWNEWLPIYCWLIRHPEGLFLVDTGECARIRERGYVPWYVRRFIRYDIAPEDEIGPQLAELGVEPADVKTVVLTHLHTDHSDGVHAFPHSEILLDPREYAAARRRRGRLSGYLPHRWPSWFQPRFIEFEDVPLGPFRRSYALTADRRIVVIPTPGHSPGHVSVVVKTENATCFLAGDLSLTPATVRIGVPFGMPSKQFKQTLQTVLQFARVTPTIYLSAHDPQGPARLARGETL
jgi:glyoxylase-like metal-dependent hydrolase (beta-lactamase superfamily II)